MTETVLNKSSNKNVGTIYLELLAQCTMIQKLWLLDYLSSCFHRLKIWTWVSWLSDIY